MNITGPAVTFTTFTIISAVRGSGTLLTATAFTSITVLALIGTPLITLFQALPLIRSAIGSMTRIQDFLNQAGRKDFCRNVQHSPIRLPEAIINVEQNNKEVLKTVFEVKGIQSKNQNVVNLVTISEADISWPSTNGRILQDISLTIPRDSLTMIVGPVGCGKSTLLKTILGETRINKGSVEISCGGIAFCDQSPWITYGTIRDNIIGLADFPLDESWYVTVLSACALRKDLEQLPDGDRTIVGSKGIALSGGQRQRLVRQLLRKLGDICSISLVHR